MLRNRIKELRDERGMSMAKLADLAGTTDSTINKLEKGQIQLDLEWIERLARSLGVHPLEVISDEVPGLRPRRPDARPYEPTKSDPLERLISATRKLWTLETNVLDELGLFAGAIVLIATDATDLTTGTPVIVDVWDAGDKPMTLVREFIEPAQLVTNSSTVSALPINTRTVRTQIRGHIIHHIRPIRRTPKGAAK